MITLSGCSLMTSTDQNNDQILVSKARLAELNISIDELLGSNMTDTSEVNETHVDNITLSVNDSEGSITEPVTEPMTENIITKTYTAGELISLSLKATDADNDKITFTFSKPLDQNGEWQTTDNDIGEYIATITASDGKSQSVKSVKLVILNPNKAPIIADISQITVTAGDIITLKPVVTDPENDDITISYSGWMTESSKITIMTDVGTHTVLITVSDGKSETTKEIVINVQKENHAPVLAELKPITIKEGDLIELNAIATDEDGDDVIITYSEPFDSNGEWQTEINDAGTYAVTVIASDGKLSDKKTVSIVVKPANSAPIIELADVNVVLNKESTKPAETKTITLNPIVKDADGDQVKITYSGFMDGNTKVVTEAEAGNHLVTLTATDSKTTVTMNIKVSIQVNHVPVFDI
jgi:hypothetical protein